MSPEDRIPRDHPLRRIRALADDALKVLSPQFDAMYSAMGRDSIAPERLLKGSLLIALYTLRGERQLCEQLEYNLLFRWFLGMDMIEPVFNHSTFSKNRERLLAHDAAGQFFIEVVNRAKRERLMSSDHFTVDSTLIEAWASLKSFKAKDAPKDPPDDSGNPTVDFRILNHASLDEEKEKKRSSRTPNTC
jgi:transposase